MTSDSSSESAAALPQATLALIPSYTLAGLPPAGTAGRLARVTDVFPGVYYDTGTAWVRVSDLPSSTLAGLPAAGTAGRLADVTDGPGGIHKDTGLQWIQTQGRLFNITDRPFNARGDGVTDDAPAFLAVWNAIAANGGGTAFVPKGKFRVVGDVVKNMLNLASFLRLTGTGSDSQIFVDNGALYFQNLHQVVVDNLVFDGREIATPRPAIAIEACPSATIENVGFYGIRVTGNQFGDVPVVRSAGSFLTVRSSAFFGSAGNGGAIESSGGWQGFTAYDTIFRDFGTLNGTFYSISTSPAGWIRVLNTVPVASADQRALRIQSVLMDELSTIGVEIIPSSATDKIRNVIIDDLSINVSGQAAGVGVKAQHVENLRIDNSLFTFATWTGTQDGLIAGTAGGVVDNVYIKNSRFQGRGERITIASTTKSLTIEDTIYTTLVSDAATTRTIIKDGKRGFGIATTPNSHLHLGGAMARAIRGTTDVTLSMTDDVVLIDATGGNRTVALPDANTVPGRQYTIKKIDASANTVTIDPDTTQTIDGAATLVLTTQYQRATIISESASAGNWQRID